MRNKLVINRLHFIVAAAIAAVGAFSVRSAVGEEAALPASATILDPDISLRESPYPTISPDGLWIAYISKGEICVCKVNEPAPRRLLEMPQAPNNFFELKWTRDSIVHRFFRYFL